jgi:hypothetical protein
MDVAYTIQKDLEDENDKLKQEQSAAEHQMKENIIKTLKEKEEGHIRWMIEAYYTDLKLSLFASSGKDIDDILAKGHLEKGEK